MTGTRACAKTGGRGGSAALGTPEWLYGALVFLLPFAVYLWTMAPTVYGLDSAELTAGAWTLGIVHSPGAPLYLLLGHVFTWLPIGDVGYRVNLMSAVAAALCALFVYRILLRLTGDRWISVMSAWILAFSYYFWAWALVAELYALHVCIAAGLLLLVLKWQDCKSPFLLCLLAFLFGLGSGNHLSLILLLPGFAWLILTDDSRPWKRWGLLIAAMISGLAGFCVYLYLPIRQLTHARMDYVRDYFPDINLTTWTGFWWMVTGRMFESLFFSVPPSQLPGEAWRYTCQLVRSFHLLGVAAGVVGLACCVKGRRHLKIALVLCFLGHLTFFLTYGAKDKEWMFSTTYLVWGIWIGLGLAWLARRTSIGQRPALQSLPQAIAAVLALLLLTSNWRLVNLSHDVSARESGTRIMDVIPRGAVFMGTWRDVPVLEYLQLVEHKRPDIDVRNLVFLGPEHRRDLVHAMLSQHVPVYTTATNKLADGRLDFLAVDSSRYCQVFVLTQEAENRP